MLSSLGLPWVIQAGGHRGFNCAFNVFFLSGLVEHGCLYIVLYTLWYKKKKNKKEKHKTYKGEKHIKGKLKTSNNAREDSTHGHHQMVNTEIRLILFFAARDGEALYGHQKQDWELTVVQIMNSLLPNSDLH